MRTFYHSTSEEAWERIQTEGVLWGVREHPSGQPRRRLPDAPSRCTWLAISRDVAYFGPVMLKVLYDYADGFRRQQCNYWDEDCWQMRVYEPIPITNVTRLS